MSANLYLRLRQLLPPSPTFIGLVLAHSETDDTCTIALPVGLATQAYAAGVTSGATITARGRTVPIGSNAFVRDGVVQSQAPNAAVSDVVLGTVIEHPFGPGRLAATVEPITLPGGINGAIYAAAIAAATVNGFPPLFFSLASGVLPPGLTLAANGRVTGTPSAVGVFSFVCTVSDSTRRSVTAPTVSITITA